MSRTVSIRLGTETDPHRVSITIPDDEPTPWQLGEQLNVVGYSTRRVDGPLKATGGAHYTYDVSLPGMLYGAIARSPYPHARIRKIDLSRALAAPGVRAAFAVEDREVRFAGQEVAAVAALTSDQAADAIRLIDIDYEPLPFVADIEAASATDAPRVYANHSNVESPSVHERGNVDNALRGAHSRIDATYTTPVQTHVALEVHGALATFEAEDRLTVWCATQGVFAVRDDLAVYFNLPPANVRVICDYLGGGFGAKFGASHEIITAARLAKAAGAPVKISLTRAEEHLATGNRPNSIQKVTLASDKDGTLAAIDLVERGSGGIGGGAGSAGPFNSIYRCANVRVSESNIYTNAGPSSPMRAPGWVQGCVALELAMDELARKLGIDRLEIRRRNTESPIRLAEYDIGASRFMWPVPPSGGLKPAPYIRRGFGVASAAWHAVGVSGPEAQAIAYRDGRVDIRIGTQDIGTGTRTLLAMVAAEELGLPLSAINCEIGDTRFLFSVPSGGSMTAPSNSPAVRQAAAHLKEKILKLAARALDANIENLEISVGRVHMRGLPRSGITFAEACRHMAGDSISAQGERIPNYAGYRTDQSGCQFAEVEVDIETGIVRVTRVVAVHDAGRIVNPLTADSQVNGGVLMGIGFALFEARRMDPQIGLVMNPTMDDYKMVGPMDTPEIYVSFVEVANGITNTGVLGLGEAAHVASAAAIACAVADAIGAPIRDLPMTPDRVLAALDSAGRRA
jgi:xanthine dehydrogenase YagR molybdenum-binding subunit